MVGAKNLRARTKAVFPLGHFTLWFTNLLDRNWFVSGYNCRWFASLASESAMTVHAKIKPDSVETAGRAAAGPPSKHPMPPVPLVYQVRQAVRSPKKVGIAILNMGISGLVFARDALAADRGELQNGSVARERSGDHMATNPTDELAPGSYTRETLPPASPEVEAILERVHAKALQFRKDEAKAGVPLKKGADSSEKIVPTDAAKRRVKPTDKGKRLVKWP